MCSLIPQQFAIVFQRCMRLGDLGMRLDDLGMRLDDLGMRLGDLEMGLGDLEMGLGDMEMGLGDLEMGVGDLEMGVGDLEMRLGKKRMRTHLKVSGKQGCHALSCPSAHLTHTLPSSWTPACTRLVVVALSKHTTLVERLMTWVIVSPSLRGRMSLFQTKSS